MAAFLIAHLPFHLKSLEVVEFMQKNGFYYRISTNVPLMNCVLSSGGGENHQLAAVMGLSEDFELGKEEVHVIANMTCIFPSEIKVEVDSRETSPPIENPVPFDRIVKEENDISAADQSEDQNPRLEMSPVAVQNVEPVEILLVVTENPSIDVEETENGKVDAHQENPEEEMNSFLNQVENSDVINENVLLADNHEFHESTAEMPLNILLSMTEEGVHDVLAESVLEEAQLGVEEEDFLGEKEGVGDEQQMQCGEDRAMTMDELLEPFDADYSTVALHPLHNNDLLFDFEDSPNDDLQMEKNPKDGDKEGIEEDEKMEEFEKEEHENDKMEEDVEDENREGEDMEEKEVDSDEEEVDDDDWKKKDGQSTGNSFGRHLFTCLVKNCSSSYKTFEELGEHIKVHTGKQEIFCNVCKSFSSKTAAIPHIQERQKKKCCECGKKFSHTGHLVEHHRRHTGEKPFVCKTCGKAFGKSCTLKRHMLIHTGDRKFSCDVCKKRFALKHALDIHERTHTGEKHFECKDCGKRFAQQVHMNAHFRIHTGEKPFSCKKCDAKFTRSTLLKYHMKKNHQ